MERQFYKTYKITQLKFWQNFWDYYKLHTFFVLLVIVMMVIGVKSCMNKVENDLKITCICGSESISSEKLEETVSGWAKDLDGDGRVTVDIFNNSILGTDTMDMAVTVLNRIDADFIAGEPFILIADDEYIGRFVNMGALQQLEEVTYGLDLQDEDVIRDTVTNKIVAINLSKMPISESIGNLSGNNMYISMKVMPESKADDEDYLKMHNHVTDIIRKMLEYKNPTH